MNEPECWLCYFYCDAARQLADYVVEPYYGSTSPIGSNWQVQDYETQEAARRAGQTWLAESGWPRGHNNSNTF